jgi:hypothetical protein
MVRGQLPCCEEVAVFSGHQQQYINPIAAAIIAEPREGKGGDVV